MTPKLQILRTADGHGLSLPMYDSRYHMGLSLQAAIPDVLKLEGGDRVYIPVGFAIGIPDSYCGFIVSLPELVKETGLEVMSAPQVIHPADRGPIFVLIQNESSHPQIIKRGDYIAQLIITPTVQVCWDEVEQTEEMQATPVSSFWIDKGEKETTEMPRAKEPESKRRPVKTIRMRVK